MADHIGRAGFVDIIQQAIFLPGQSAGKEVGHLGAGDISCIAVKGTFGEDACLHCIIDIGLIPRCAVLQGILSGFIQHMDAVGHDDGLGHRQRAGRIIGGGRRALDQAIFKGSLDRAVIPCTLGYVGKAGIGPRGSKVLHAAGGHARDAQCAGQGQHQHERNDLFHISFLSFVWCTKDRPMAGLPQC